MKSPTNGARFLGIERLRKTLVTPRISIRRIRLARGFNDSVTFAEFVEKIELPKNIKFNCWRPCIHSRRAVHHQAATLRTTIDHQPLNVTIAIINNVVSSDID